MLSSPKLSPKLPAPASLQPRLCSTALGCVAPALASPACPCVVPGTLCSALSWGWRHGKQKVTKRRSKWKMRHPRSHSLLQLNARLKSPMCLWQGGRDDCLCRPHGLSMLQGAFSTSRLTSPSLCPVQWMVEQDGSVAYY